MPPNAPDEFLDFNVSAALGAEPGVSIQALVLYIPNKDRHEVEIGNQRKWVLEAMTLLGPIGGGATALPPAEGIWLDSDGVAAWDYPILVYCYVLPEKFAAELARVREFLHRLGRETNQGEVAFEFNDAFYRIRDFDPPGVSSHAQKNS